MELGKATKLAREIPGEIFNFYFSHWQKNPADKIFTIHIKFNIKQAVIWICLI